MLDYILGLFRNLTNPAVPLFCKIDNSSRINRKAKVNSFTQVYHSNLGEYSYLGRRSSLVYAEVGSFCSIGDEVKVGLGIHTLTHLSTSPLFTEKNNGTGSSWCDKDLVFPFDRIFVGNDVWIGERVMIMGGVHIGNGAVIGAGAIVTKDIPAYAIVAGVPAKLIRYRFTEEEIAWLEQLKWWNLPDEVLKKNISLFQREEISIDDIKTIVCEYNEQKGKHV